MTERIAKAQRIADKWADAVVRLEAEVAARRAKLVAVKARAMTVSGRKGQLIAGWYREWDRNVLGLARAIGALDRAKRMASKAPARVRQAKLQTAKRARIDSMVDSLVRKADMVSNHAPKATKRWAAERAQEGRRLQKRKAVLQKRVTKDRQQEKRREWTRIIQEEPSRSLPPPVVQPKAEDLIETLPPEPPPRPGLLPGDYKMLPIGRLIESAEPQLPAEWTPQYVADRMIEAHKVLRRLPMQTRPKEYGAIWPEYIHDRADAFGQAISGSLQDRNRVISGTSAEEVARMVQALGWPLEYLRDADAAVKRELNDWIFAEVFDWDLREITTYPGRALDAIAAGLNAKKIAVA